jgi:hypothetical protein
VVFLLAIGLNVRGFKTGGKRWIFKGDKNPWRASLRRGIKAVSPTSLRLFGMLEIPVQYDGDTSAKFKDFFLPISCFATRRAAT